MRGNREKPGEIQRNTGRDRKVGEIQRNTGREGPVNRSWSKAGVAAGSSYSP